MNYLIFENAGEIDLLSVTTFGCSVKETKNPIGFFGTGLKYGIAVLLRTGHKITIQSGLKQFECIASKGPVRGVDFEFVQIEKDDGTKQAAGFTTELGKTWEVWMAYRELYCNAKDENDHQIIISENTPEPTQGRTRFIVEGEPILKAHRSKTDFICEGVADFVIGTLEVFRRPSQSFFYRGIKVMDFQRPCLFTYNQTAHVDLTEDRTAKDPYCVPYGVAREIIEHADAEFLEGILVADDKSQEHFFDFFWDLKPSPDFYPTVEKLQRSSVMKVNHTALRMWREKGRGFIDPRRIKPTIVQLKMLEKAIAFCEKSGFMLRDEYPILLVESLGDSGVLAMADPAGKQIFLTERIFQMSGTKGVARALIEEYLHLRFNFQDDSREMQNFLFDKMMSLAEELNGEPI